MFLYDKPLDFLKKSEIYDNFCSMKNLKYILSFLFILLFSTPVLADVMPYYTGAISKQTIGFLQVPQKFNLYLYPRNDSQIVENVSWDRYEVRLKNKKMEPSELFVSQVTKNNYAFCMVIDTQDDWYKIVYDKLHNKSAWIKPESQENFWGLKDFYSYYGKKYGLYYMKDVDYRKRGIYSGAEINSQKLGSFTLIKTIRLNKISGNFALVTVVDFNKLPQIGYVQWREQDGTILIFPKIDY